MISKKVKIIAWIFLIVGVLFSFVCCTAETSSYEKLSSDGKMLVDYIINSWVLNSADYVDVKTNQGNDYLVVSHVISKSERAQTINSEFYPILSTSIGSKVTGTDTIPLEATMTGGFTGRKWNNSDAIGTKKEILAEILIKHGM